VFFAALMSASFIWCFICAGIVARVLKGANATWTRVTYQLCALAFLVLALSSLRELLTQSVVRSTQPSPAIIKPR
jgi:chemosensory pili system protein ChpE